MHTVCQRRLEECLLKLLFFCAAPFDTGYLLPNSGIWVDAYRKAFPYDEDR